MDTGILTLMAMVFVFAGMLFAAVGFTIRGYYRAKIERIVGGCANNLSLLLDGGEDKIGMLNPEREAAYYYSELKRVNHELKINDESRNEMVRIINSIATNIDLTGMLNDIIPKFLEATRSNCGAFYMANHATNKLELKASMGFSKNIYSDFDLSLGEGFIGTAASSGEVRILTDIPDDSVYVFRSFLGKVKPKGIMVVPIINREQLLGVLLLASVYGYTDDKSEIIEMIKYYIGVAVNNGITFEKTTRLTNELKFQNKLIQNLNEELEKKAEERTVFLNSIVDSIMDYAIYAMDKNGVVLAWNKGAESIMGYKKEEVYGKSIKYIYSEEDYEKVDMRIESAIRDERYEESGWRVKKDGSAYYSEMVLFAMRDANGNLLGFTNVTKDTTALRRAESELGYEREFVKKMFEDSFQAMLLTSPEGIIEIANKSGEKLFDVDDLVGSDICSMFLDGEYLRKNLLDVKNRYGRGEWACTTTDGARNIAFKVAVLYGSMGAEAKLFIDLTAVKTRQGGI